MLSAIVNAKIVLEDRIVEDYVVIFDQSIKDIVCKNESGKYADCYMIDAKGAYLSAGFIDLHIHGSGGADTMDASLDALQTISDTVLQTGTTSFLATTMTMSKDDIVNALVNIRDNARLVNGASILGVHMEGPFINPAQCGAQDKEFILAPSMEIIDEFAPFVKMITFAPEVAGGMKFVENINAKYPHVILSIGHSNASYEEAKKSFDAGVSHATHLGNAMSGFHHRTPGVLGAVLDSDITCDVIADGIHTHKASLHIFWKQKKEKLILITDAMRAGCMKCGAYNLGGQEVMVANGKATLADGRLAGSVLKLNEALANMLEFTDMTLEEAIYSVTAAPARKLGIKKGFIKAGYDADMVLFDEKLDILSTIVDGKIKYTKG
ncbi:MAG: N-acetylglucosamine-6-phosphate deacetylase [Campylobacterales bacterium]|nr:N-acetylglucosamine-6-phosphate deacetylase [Campylobacterales bacterium]